MIAAQFISLHNNMLISHSLILLCQLALVKACCQIKTMFKDSSKGQQYQFILLLFMS